MGSKETSKAPLTRLETAKHMVIYLGRTYKLSNLEIKQLRLDIVYGKIDYKDIVIRQKRGINYGTNRDGDDYAPAVYIDWDGSLSDKLRGFSTESEIEFAIMMVNKAAKRIQR